MYSNVEILSAVIARWIQPLVTSIAAANMNKIPFIGNIEAKIKASGWVSPNWNIANELSPFMPSVSQAMIKPALLNALSGISDDQVPAFAYGIVDTAIERGSLEILDGNVKFNKEDLLQLRRLLELNLPLPTESYKVKEEEVC
jgi:hypothetical protein